MLVGTTLTSNHRTQYLLKEETKEIMLDIQHELAKLAAFSIKNSFSDFAKNDLAAHGSRMFAFISKESKAHLSINNTVHPSYSHNPDAHLEKQTPSLGTQMAPYQS